MSGHGHDTQFPKLPLYSAATLIGAAILLVLLSRATGVGELRTPQAAVTAERTLRFLDQPDGSITIEDAGDAHLIERVAPGSNGFLRGTLRGLGRERKRDGIGPDAVFRLTGRSDGRLLLEDPATGRMIDLGAFGPTNAAVFAHLLAPQDVVLAGGAPAPVASVGTNDHVSPVNTEKSRLP